MNEPKSLLIRDGRIIDPAQGLDETASLVITEGKIAWLGRGDPPRTDSEVIDGRGLVVTPGFIDLHCHLRQPGFEEKETIASGSRAAAAGGFTTICGMPNTEPPLDSPETISYVKRTAAREAVVRVLPIGCISQGRKGERLVDMKALVNAGAIAFSDDGSPVPGADLMLKALEVSRSLEVPIIDHCEDTSLSEGGVMNEGALAHRLKLKGIPAAAEESIIARDLALAEETGGHIHIAHVSTAGGVKLIRRAKERGVRATAEVTPHHLTLTEERVAGYDTSAKVNPPLRTKVDTQALLEGLKDGTIDIIATDHAPHTEAEKSREFALAPFGISGLETALGSLMGLVHSGNLNLTILIAKLTTEPARIIGGRYGELGTLKIGAPAEITIFDPDMERVVDPQAFASKGKNTPLAGSKLKGKVVATIAGGRLVYRHSSLKITKAAAERTELTR
ncbi:MAG: dihydroorotase [Dehalococcoidales bacterium]|nr:dihydroorotase [Dehalococcoidales bacterium]